MKALKSLKEKLDKNKWAYWFLLVSIIMYVSTSIQNKTVNEILFAEYSGKADKISVWLFISLMLFLGFKWYEKYKKQKPKI